MAIAVCIIVYILDINMFNYIYFIYIIILQNYYFLCRKYLIFVNNELTKELKKRISQNFAFVCILIFSLCKQILYLYCFINLSYTYEFKMDIILPAQENCYRKNIQCQIVKSFDFHSFVSNVLYLVAYLQLLQSIFFYLRVDWTN